MDLSLAAPTTTSTKYWLLIHAVFRGLNFFWALQLAICWLTTPRCSAIFFQIPSFRFLFTAKMSKQYGRTWRLSLRNTEKRFPCPVIHRFDRRRHVTNHPLPQSHWPKKQEQDCMCFTCQRPKKQRYLKVTMLWNPKQSHQKFVFITFGSPMRIMPIRGV